MSILILDSVGAGAVIGSRLSAVGNPVTYLDDPGRAFALEFEPLEVASRLGNYSEYVDHLEPAEIRHVVDLVVIAGAPHRLGELAPHLSRAIGPSTTVLVLTPGLEPLEEIRKACRGAAVLDGQHNIGALVDDGGVVHQLGNGSTILVGAPSHGDMYLAEQIAARFSGTGLCVRIVPDARYCRWGLMVRAVSVCALAALLEGRVESLGAAETEDRTLLWSLLQECADIAGASGYAGSVAALASFVERLPASARGPLEAMLRRIEHGDIAEIIELAAQMQRAARVANVASPILDLVVRALLARQAGRPTTNHTAKNLRRRLAPAFKRDGWFSRRWALRRTGGGQ